MNLQQLRYVVAVSDFGSVSAAARSLQVTQPVVTRSLRAFEAEHSLAVSCRSGRCLVPTDAGRAVVEAARQALAAVEDVGKAARAARGQSELTLATTPTSGLLLAFALSDFGRRRPQIELRVCRAGDTDGVLDLVRGGGAEIGFGETDLMQGDPALAVQPAIEAEIVLVSPVGSDLPVAVSWEDVLRQPLILPPASSGRRQLIDEVAATACGSHPQAPLVIEERSSWVAAAQAGMGSFLSYRPVVARLEHVEIRSFQPMRTAMVGFVHRAGPVSAAAAELIRTAQAPGQAAPG